MQYTLGYLVKAMIYYSKWTTQLKLGSAECANQLEIIEKLLGNVSIDATIGKPAVVAKTLAVEERINEARAPYVSSDEALWQQEDERGRAGEDVEGVF